MPERLENEVGEREDEKLQLINDVAQQSVQLLMHKSQRRALRDEIDMLQLGRKQAAHDIAAIDSLTRSCAPSGRSCCRAGRRKCARRGKAGGESWRRNARDGRARCKGSTGCCWRSRRRGGLLLLSKSWSCNAHSLSCNDTRRCHATVLDETVRCRFCKNARKSKRLASSKTQC